MKRVRILVLLISLVISSLSLSARGYGRSSMGIEGFRFGVKAGLNLSTIKSRTEFNYKAGFYVGIVEEFKITENFSFQPEFIYSQQGALDKDNNDIRYKYDYFLLPIMTVIHASDMFNIQFGPQFGYNLSAQKEDEHGTTTPIKNDVNKFDFGFNMRVGVEVSNNFAINLGYHWGVTEIKNKQDNRNMVFNVGLVAKL